VGAVKVNDSLEMGFRRRMGAGGKGKFFFWRWNSSKGWVLVAKVKKIFWKRNFSEGWVLRLSVGAAKVNNFLEMGFR